MEKTEEKDRYRERDGENGRERKKDWNEKAVHDPKPVECLLVDHLHSIQATKTLYTKWY